MDDNIARSTHGGHLDFKYVQMLDEPSGLIIENVEEW
jgi:hypothetical protein